MSRQVTVPITPAVLGWAVEASGYDEEQLAGAIGVPTATMRAWLEGEERPQLTQLRKLATRLRRPLSAFLLPQPPSIQIPTVQFRHPPGAGRRRLNPEEIRWLRQAGRMQRVVSWILEELREELVDLPAASLESDPEEMAARTRGRLGFDVEEQLALTGVTDALKWWRAVLHRSGVMVFYFPMGEQACRGFSLFDERAPVVAVNTWWNEAARIFTMLHELGHLLTRTSSACLEGFTGTKSTTADLAERWCERFAAAVLLPWPEVAARLEQRGWSEGAQVSNLETVREVARTFKTSLRATAIRLIEKGAAAWDLYQLITLDTEYKKRTGGKGRARAEMREDQLGRRATELLVTAVNEDVLSRMDALSYLDIPERQLDALQLEVAETAHWQTRAS